MLPPSTQSLSTQDPRQEGEANSQLLRRLTHDLLTPISVMKILIFSMQRGRKGGRSGSLDRGDNGSLSHESRGLHHDDTVEQLDLQLRRMEQIISDFRSFALPLRAEAQRLECGGILHELKTRSEKRFQTDGPPLISIDCAPGVFVRANSDLLMNAFLRLIENSMEAYEDGYAELTIRVESRTYRGQAYADILFQDSGCGITPEVVERIFEPGFTDKMGHIGLGLSIARKMITTMGGELGLESTGKGWSCFCVRLPLDRGEVSSLDLTEQVSP